MINEDLRRLARNLKTARRARGITQPAAGGAVEKTRQTIVNWESETNTAEPSSAELSVLAELYGVSSRDLRFAELERQSAAPRVEPPHARVIQGKGTVLKASPESKRKRG